MKKSLLLIALFFFTISKINAQAVQWALLQDICPIGMGGASEPYIVSDGDDVISVGRISNSISFGNQTMTSNFGRSNYLVKHDKTGNLLWAIHLIGPEYETKLTVDNNKNIIVTGTYSDSLVIGNLHFPNSGGLRTLFIAKFSPFGNLLWTRTSGQSTTGYLSTPTLTTDGSGNIYVAGGYHYNFSVGSTILNSLGVDDIFLLKYDSNGTLQWLKNFGTIGTDRNPSLIGGLTNNVYFAFSSQSKGYQIAGPNGYYLKKINNTGTEQWSKFVSLTSGYYQTFLSRDAAENVYMSAPQDTTLVFGTHTISINPATTLYSNAFIAKINSAGNWKWAKPLPANGTPGQLIFMASQNKNELNTIRYSFNQNILNIQLAKLDTSGTIIKTSNFNNLNYYSTPTTPNILRINYATSDNAGNTYLSGGVGGNNIIGTLTLNAPPAIIGPGLPRPSAGFIAKLLDNSNTISGKLFIDLNSNGIKESSEQAYENGLIEISQGPAYTNTTSNGNYLFHLPSGSFNLQVVQPANHYTFLPQNHSVSFSGIGQNQAKDFALVPISNRNDVKVTVTNLTPARPGFRLKYRITLENVGTTALSDTLQLNYTAGNLTFDSASISPASQQSGKLRWFYQNLQPTQKRNIDVNFTVSTTTSINTQLTALATIKPLNTDFIPVNNLDTLYHPVTGSFDPNDKQVSRSWLTPQQVAYTPLLDYVIRFQNTGNDTAFTVIVRDSISDKLQMSSFELLSASHPYKFRLLENGMAEWRFYNILLPDSNRNEPASHGFIRYRMRPKNNLVLGDEIKSRAAIYFDYNSPIHTNYAVTKISLTNGIKENKEANIQAFKLYPNPAKNYVMVEAAFKKNTSATVSLVNILGQTISKVTLPANDQIHYQMPLNELLKGVYLIKLQTETGMQTQRLVIH